MKRGKRGELGEEVRELVPSFDIEKENEAWARVIARKGSGWVQITVFHFQLHTTMPYRAGPLTLNRPKLINGFSKSRVT